MRKKIKYDKRNGTLQFNPKIVCLTGMEMLYPNGMAKNGKWYSFVYSVDYTNHICGLFNILRFYDIRFKLLYDLKADGLFLQLSGEYEDSVQAENDMYVLEADIAKNLPAGIAISPLDFSGRISLLHHMSVLNNEYINTDNYCKEGEWIEEILMKNVIEREDYLENGTEAHKAFYRLFYMQNPDELKKIRQSLNVRYLLFDFADVSDQGIRMFMEENYLDLEDAEYYIRERSPVLYQVLFEPGRETETLYEDQRLFTLMGIYMVQESTKEDFSDCEQFDSDSVKQCTGFQKKMYQAVLPNGNEAFSQMRIYESDVLSDIMDDLI